MIIFDLHYRIVSTSADYDPTSASANGEIVLIYDIINIIIAINAL